jgi:spore cortex formation protein SpoVR/YcgB (stage V sporulation)
MGALREAWANYRDESFILQYLSPALIRKFRLFHVADDARQSDMKVAAIHDERGYRAVRQALARQYDIAWAEADIQIVDVDLVGDRKLMLEHHVMNQILLEEEEARAVMQHLADLWGYEVVLAEVETPGGTPLRRIAVSPRIVLGGG